MSDLFNLIYEYWYVIVGIFVVVKFSGSLSSEPEFLRDDEVKGRARSWLYNLIKNSEDDEKITHQETMSDGSFNIETRNKYGEDTNYFIYEDEE